MYQPKNGVAGHKSRDSSCERVKDRDPLRHRKDIRQFLLRDFPLKALDFEEEAIHQQLYRNLIDAGTDEVLKKIADLADIRKKCVDELRKKVKLQKVPRNEDSCFKRIVGVDAGRNGNHLRLAFIPIYGAVATLVENWRIIEDPMYLAGIPDIWITDEDPERRESLLHLALQYYIAKKAVKKWNPDFVFFDGALALNPRLTPGSRDPEEYRRDFIFAVMTALSLFESCRDREVGLIGFVKRTKMSRYYRELGIPPIRDSSLLNLIMDVGEYTEPLPLENPVTEIYGRVAEEAGLSDEKLRLYTFFIKNSPMPPYRVEIPFFSIDKIDDATSALFLMSDPDGIPYPIYEADRCSKVTRRTATIHALVLYEKAIDLVKKGKMSSEDLDMLIPQYGERWSTRELWEDER